MLTLPPSEMISARLAAAFSGVRTWWLVPQWSNQPFQNSATKNGSSGRWVRTSALASAGFEPSVTAASTPGVVPSVSMGSVGPSAVNSSSVMPRSRSSSAMAAT